LKLLDSGFRRNDNKLFFLTFYDIASPKTGGNMAGKKKGRKISGKKAGLSPGSLVYVGSRTDEPVRISIMDYDADRIDEIPEATLDDIKKCMARDSVTWVNVSGIHDTAIVEAVGRLYHLHPLALEDIVNTRHRAKLDDYENHLFLVLKMVIQEPETIRIVFEHVCLVIGPDYLISFQEREGDVFGPVRERLRKTKGRIRKSGPDYLGYALMDMIVDHYYEVLDQLGEEIEAIQEEALSNPTAKMRRAIHDARRQVVVLRKTIWPLREIVAGLLRGESKLFQDGTMIFLQDVYDHVVQVIDTVETYRDLLTGAMETYMSSVSNKMNETMKVLTIMATLFIPLTFLAGVYGMNFKYMPELEWRYAYPSFWGIVLVVFLAMLLWFKNKNWL